MSRTANIILLVIVVALFLLAISAFAPALFAGGS